MGYGFFLQIDCADLAMGRHTRFKRLADSQFLELIDWLNKNGITIGMLEMYNNNYLDKDFIYLADAFIDRDAFNSFFGSSVLKMVKFYMEVFIMFFDNPEYQNMMNTKGIEKMPIGKRNWSQNIKGAMSLHQGYPEILEIANRQVTRRTKNFLEVHDLKTYVTANKKEWIDTHSMLTGKAMKEKECLPYVFGKIVSPG